ncbi:hypothetical protein C7447_103185 [Tenacibaculum adriaticum]|uniref:Uncharacterized protein n=1 Tax=Tenacibaculum adriaticum TaxID=413713 RepID=A0A5S5DQ43_9FLAO|nr:hypothetical protein [Tenacibaculum adriaticum]TYP98017.1 hypothetical protein C7447_103185 [Tenacibaculum adriaticum]
MKTFLKIIVLNTLLLVTSCVKDIDFNQAQDFEITPEVAVSLVKFNLDQNDLVMGGIEIDSISQSTVFTMLDNTTAQEDLVKIDFQFEVVNTFNRDFEINLIFLDDNDIETYRISTLKINAQDEDFNYIETLVISDHQEFLLSRKIQVILRLLPSSDGSTIDPNDPRTFVFKSAGIFYFRID